MPNECVILAFTKMFTGHQCFKISTFRSINAFLLKIA